MLITGSSRDAYAQCDYIVMLCWKRAMAHLCAGIVISRWPVSHQGAAVVPALSMTANFLYLSVGLCGLADPRFRHNTSLINESAFFDADEVLAWLSAWSEVQMICVWCSPADSTAARMVLPFWCRLTRVVLERRPLNGCLSQCVCLSPFFWQPFVRLFAVCYRTVFLSCLSVYDVGVLCPNG